MKIYHLNRRHFLSSSSCMVLSVGLAGLPSHAHYAPSIGDKSLLSTARLIFPHVDLDDGPYVRGLEGFESSPDEIAAFLKVLTDDGRSFSEMTIADQKRVLADNSAHPVFNRLVGHLRANLYEDPEVWDVIGYQGSSLEYGGYLYRGFDDIDWLPAVAGEAR